MSGLQFSLDLPVRREWANIDLLRTSVQSCFAAVFTDLESCRALALVTAELLENAVKYGDWSGVAGDDPRFRLRVWGEGRSANVSVENPVRRNDPNAEAVLQTLGWLRGFASTDVAYRAKLLEIAATRDPERSKLGLVRIAYESNCQLTAELVRGVLHVQAALTV